ncbi:MAG: quinolinate synthase NadA [Xanthomonadaceae bacterium]|nr:quinolinate synthase NadA [Xanthomonadaceae bacterium]
MKSHTQIEDLLELKRRKNAVILAHYYQDSDIQDIADFIGDSLDLARAAKSTNADRILFCGVHFMAEGAKILNPSRQVLIPDLKAGCSLSDGCPPDKFAAFKKQFDNPFVISYINCSAEIKALSDVICTSTNAEKILSRAPKDRPIIFAPDKNLGGYLKKKTGRDMSLWNGSCMVHETFSRRKIIDLKTEYPDAELIAHPECVEELLKHAEFIGSTSALLKHVISSPVKKFIVATEAGILHQMQKQAPTKILIPAPPEASCACNECPYMKLNTLDKMYAALDTEKPELFMNEDLRLRALKPLELMLEWSN